MEHKDDKTPVQLGVFAGRSGTGLSGPEVVALGLSVVWLLVATVFFFVGGGLAGEGLSTSIRIMILLLSVVLPIAMICRVTPLPRRSTMHAPS